jgi:hypothetical protein
MGFTSWRRATARRFSPFDRKADGKFRENSWAGDGAEEAARKEREKK